ncbi:MAG: hypothetical protein OJF60_002827 [Burkholderiaceae bacterium]|jgi:hypothetical protein|nr:MAG: hypothetical protein OJF60_002827 [Burkholderiaceae bacterium]
MFRRILFLLQLSCCGAAFGQAPAGAPNPNAPGPKLGPNQRIERIHHEDAGSTIDELRYGGQTLSIKVQPKTDVPPYEVRPANGIGGTQPTGSDRDPTAGQPSWKILTY